MINNYVRKEITKFAKTILKAQGFEGIFFGETEP